MSGTASRYIGGVPYDPSRSVGRYPTRASILTGPTTRDYGGGAVMPAATDGTGIALDPANGTVRAAPMAGASGNNALLLSALLGALSYAPDAYNWLSKQLGPDQAQTNSGQQAGGNTTAGGGSGTGGAYVSGDLGAGTAFPNGARFITGPSGKVVDLPQGAVQGIDGIVDLPDGSFFDATSYLDLPGNTSSLPMAPVEGLDFVPGDGGSLMAPVDGVTVGSAAPSDTGINWSNPFGVRTGLEETLGTLGGVDVANGLANMGAGIMGAYATRGLAGRSPERQMSATIGSTLSGAIGSLLGPAGAFAGAAGGGAIGGQIGAQPTIGRNFAGVGTFTGDGGLSWGQFGGDNGGNADDAQGAAAWFTPALQSLAQQYGYAFNPNAAGAQIRIGGYNNFDRNMPGVGGFFYDMAAPGGQFGGSPERYTLRPDQSTYGWGGNSAFGRGDVFTQNVLADLVARNVFTPGGQAADYYGGNADYGFYNPADDFQTNLQNRQAIIGGAWDTARHNALSGAATPDQIQNVFVGGDGGQWMNRYTGQHIGWNLPTEAFWQGGDLVDSSGQSIAGRVDSQGLIAPVDGSPLGAFDGADLGWFGSNG
jgi:hypothetical protein